MSDDLSLQGSLSETTVPDLLGSMIRSGESGTVSLEALGRHDNIYLSDGEIIFATSSDADLGLAEVMLRNGDLNLEQYMRVGEATFGSRRIETILCELGFVTEDELPPVLERQVASIVTRALAFRNGSFTVDFSSEFSREIARLPINTDRLILDGMSRIELWSLISRGIGRMDRVLRQTTASDAKIFHLEMTEEESHVYGLLSEPATVTAVCERSYLSNFATCRTAWALLTVNLVGDAEEEQIDRSRADAESELELEVAVEKYNHAFQSLFGIVFQKIGDHTYDFVDRVVSRLSPEIVPYLSGISFVNEGRVDFDQLLNNLIASGSSERQSIVKRVLNELLQGWVREIRSEFGTAFDREVARTVSALR